VHLAVRIASGGSRETGAGKRKVGNRQRGPIFAEILWNRTPPDAVS
jgi:hypothetical protein